MVTMAKVGLPEAKYRVSLVEKGRSHWYDVKGLDGKQLAFLPGVTGVLGIINKPALVPWARNEALKSVEGALLKRLKGKAQARVNVTPEWVNDVIEDARKRPDEIKDKAADLGTKVHDCIDRIIKGEDLVIKDVPDDARPAVENFLTWFNASGIQMIMGDTAVASVSGGFGGKLDGLGWRRDHYVLLDWKTSKGIYPEYALQVAAYATAFEETYSVPIGEAAIARFDKELPEWNPAKDIKWVENLTVSYGAFLAAKELQTLLKDHEHYRDA